MVPASALLSGKALVGFVRFLREQGFPVGPGQSLDVVRLGELGLLGTRRHALLSLRTLLCDPANFSRFEDIFNHYFDGQPSISRQRQKQRSNTLAQLKKRMLVPGQDSGEAQDEIAELAQASAIEVLCRKDLAALTGDDLTELEQLAQRLFRALAMRDSRRRKSARRGRQLHLRALLRANLKFGGELITLRYLRKRQRPAPLLFLLDCSGSMDRYSLFFLRFIHAIKTMRPRVEVFAFSTELWHLSPVMDRKDLRSLLQALPHEVSGWSGGTLIGDALAALLHGKAAGFLQSTTRVFVLSDGLEVGDPEVLGQHMARLRQRCARIFWLNPLLRFTDYQPEARGMAAAMPHIHRLLPAHNLESLLALEDLLI